MRWCVHVFTHVREDKSAGLCVVVAHGAHTSTKWWATESIEACIVPGSEASRAGLHVCLKT